MLNDVETGYEAKFDFPLTAGQPEIVYLLATVPRTGSTYLSHILWQTGCLGAPLEYVNSSRAAPTASPPACLTLSSRSGVRYFAAEHRLTVCSA